MNSRVGALGRRRDVEQFELLAGQVVDEVVPRRLVRTPCGSTALGSGDGDGQMATWLEYQTMIAASPCPVTLTRPSSFTAATSSSRRRELGPGGHVLGVPVGVPGPNQHVELVLVA